MPERDVALSHVLVGNVGVERIASQYERRHQGGGGKRRPVELAFRMSRGAGNGLHTVGEEETRHHQRLVHGPEV